MVCCFQSRWTGQAYVERLVVNKPVVPHDNPFDRMSDRQMGVFKQKLVDLRDACNVATVQPDVARAIAALKPHFGTALMPG